MTTWINKIAHRLVAFLSTEDNKYIVTETGLKILVINNKGSFKTRSYTSFSRKNGSITNWNNKLKS